MPKQFSRTLDIKQGFDMEEESRAAVGFITDLARDPSSAHQLIKLGISPRKDLPALLLTDAGGKLRLVGLRMEREEAYRKQTAKNLIPRAGTAGELHDRLTRSIDVRRSRLESGF